MGGACCHMLGWIASLRESSRWILVCGGVYRPWDRFVYCFRSADCRSDFGQTIAQAKHNATTNGLDGRTTFITANAFDWLRTTSEHGPQFDLGVLDPPAFTKSRDAVARALKGYKEINLRAIKLIRPGGILVTSSCSYHVSEADFIGVISDAANDAKRHVKIMEIRGQGPDHPILPALPESRYLKCLIVEVGE